MGAQPQQALAPIENAHVEAAYARWAPVYDFTFELVMRQGRRAAAAAASRPGGTVLDVGVGTGLELPMFEPGTRLVGVDLSEPMLKRAAARVRRDKLINVDGLAVMDAMRLAFSDSCFDAAVAPYVLTVVPDPAATLDELHARRETRRRDRPRQSCRRRKRADRRDRSLAWPAFGFARLAAAISLGDHCRLDRRAVERASCRAPRHRAARFVYLGADPTHGLNHAAPRCLGSPSRDATFCFGGRFAALKVQLTRRITE